jgi:two-component system, OmpR family, phosphate regulon sensor histidine kinase PhoR
MSPMSLTAKLILLSGSMWALSYFSYSSGSLSLGIFLVFLGFTLAVYLALDLQRATRRQLRARAHEYKSILSELNSQVSTLSTADEEHMAIFNSMSEGIVAIDETSKVKYANPAAAQILDLGSTDKFIGKSIGECIRNPEILAYLEMAVNSESSVSQEIPLYDSAERWLQIQSSPLAKENQRRQGTIAVFSDVSQIKRLENLRHEFVANVSHELRTPLTSIHGFAETLLKNPGMNQEQARPFLDIIYTQSRRLGNLIDDLLSLSRIESAEETQALEVAPRDLSSVAQAAAKICGSDRLKIIVKQNPQANVNVALLEQACINLMENALRYGGEKDIQVEIDAGEKFGSIAVIDHGPGISKEHLPRLFERFYRADRARSQKLGGTGLGLAIVKHIVLAHQGRVEVQSEVKKGSTFTLFLPLTQTAQI